MPIIKADRGQTTELLQRSFRGCRPRILVVTDSLSFVEDDGLGLTELVATLRASTVHGMTPWVVTALFDPAGTPCLDATGNHIEHFRFTDPRHGVSTSHYDVVFMLSNNGTGEGEHQLTDEPGALEAVTGFMQAGGGLFATGDHEDLGAGMCKDVPRVRSMRHWKRGETPSAGGPDRLTTILPGRGDQPGSNDVYELSDQSDRFPQRLFVNFRTHAARPPFVPVQRFAHPVLQADATRAIEVFPDHANEGECVIPCDLEAPLLGGEREWPLEGDSLPPVAPEMVALSMSHGNGINRTSPTIAERQAVVPRSFIAIAAYDGHRCSVGRVVTDASYHHFVNANIRPGKAAIGKRDLADIKQYYVNLAVWLMPKQVRRRQRHPWLLGELARHPLCHEVPQNPSAKLDAARARQVGGLVEQALLTRYSRADVDELIGDTLEDGIGLTAQRELERVGDAFGSVSAHDVGLAALGAFSVASAERFNALASAEMEDGATAFAGTERASAAGAKLYLASIRGQVARLASLVDSIAG